MKNFGTLLFCLAYLFGCSTAHVKELRLGSGKQGFDLKCVGNALQCEKSAKTLCDGRFRVHNLFQEDPIALSIGKYKKDYGLTMRLECLENTAKVERECSRPGVKCVL